MPELTPELDESLAAEFARVTKHLQVGAAVLTISIILTLAILITCFSVTDDSHFVWSVLAAILTLASAGCLTISIWITRPTTGYLDASIATPTGHDALVGTSLPGGLTHSNALNRNMSPLDADYNSRRVTTDGKEPVATAAMIKELKAALFAEQQMRLLCLTEEVSPDAPAVLEKDEVNDNFDTFSAMSVRIPSFGA